MPDRAILFVDGSNWYHALKGIGVVSPGRLDYAKLSQKLVGPRIWVATRYYIGQVRQVGNRRLYRDQRRFLAGLRNSDPRISIHLGRLEPRTVENEGARELQQYLHRCLRASRNAATICDWPGVRPMMTICAAEVVPCSGA